MKNKKIFYIILSILIVVSVIVIGVNIYNKNNTNTTNNENSNSQIANEKERTLQGTIIQIQDDIVRIEDENLQTFNIKISQDVYKIEDLDQADKIKIFYKGEIIGEIVATKIEVLSKDYSGEKTVKGEIVDATMNNIIVKINDKDYVVSLSNAETLPQGGIEIGKVVTITYQGELANGMQASKIE